ncbi:tetratricopeptide repeat protein [Mucilaginibacter rigui]|uniref:histidine kinase n=1 Tax=Mucilaginibacter rigui TaxID=534635 RepID=A0ABR7X5T4_9SPHI|nr:histidine kinase dimerization/phosphoacceptor domain -containing protein [Mucilaginibacter rigui]MBD1385915.1 tetratricopeptide repeat protein [Mucilaginibacter rigui]
MKLEQLIKARNRIAFKCNLQKVTCTVTILLGLLLFPLEKLEAKILAVSNLKTVANDTINIRKSLNLAVNYSDKDSPADLKTALKLSGEVILATQAPELRKFREEATFLKSKSLLRLGLIKEATAAISELINSHHKFHETAKEADTWAIYALYLRSAGPDNYLESISYFKRAADLYRIVPNPKLALDMMKEQADIYLNLGRLDEAERMLIQVVSGYSKIGYKKLYKSYDLLAATERLKKDVNKQLFYRIETVKSMELTGDYQDATYYYAKLAMAYYSIKRFDQAEKYFIKALAAKKSDNYELLYHTYLAYAAEALMNQNKFAEANKLLTHPDVKFPKNNQLNTISYEQAVGRYYAHYKKPDLARFHFLRSIEVTDSLFNLTPKQLKDADYFGLLIRASKGLINLKYYNDSRTLMQKASKIPNLLFDPVYVSEYEHQMYLIDSIHRNFPGTLRHFKKYVSIRDSLFNIDKTRKIDSLQFAFESQQKDKDIITKSKNITSLTKIGALQKVELKQSKIIQSIIFVSIILLILACFLIYYRYQKQIRSNRLLEVQRKEIAGQNLSLERLNARQHGLITEKEWLIKEIHHRVKNNLQVVKSLLSSHAVYLKDQAALNAVAESQHRIQAMSLIHQKLYNRENITDVYMPEYIGDLVDYLTDSFEISKTVIVEQQIDRIRLDVASAVPVGLILNELMTNAYKYAFPHSDKDRLLIQLKQVDNIITLLVADNGKGFPSNFNSELNNSFGMTLMNGMAEDLEGTISFEDRNGIRVTVKFENSLVDNVTLPHV